MSFMNMQYVRNFGEMIIRNVKIQNRHLTILGNEPMVTTNVFIDIAPRTVAPLWFPSPSAFRLRVRRASLAVVTLEEGTVGRDHFSAKVVALAIGTHAQARRQSTQECGRRYERRPGAIKRRIL